MDRTTVIKALRCSATPRTSETDCTKCPYRWLEPVTDLIPMAPDVVIDGVHYWESCDCNKICLDAANLLEMELDDGR